MMRSHHPITYCVPLDEVDSNENYYFPAATASYSTLPTDDNILQLDQDFYDVIDALAEFDSSDDLFDLDPLPTVALPVSADDDCSDFIPTASTYCVPHLDKTTGTSATASAHVTPTATATMATTTANCGKLKVVPAVPLCTAEECTDDACFGAVFEYSHSGVDKKLIDLSPAEKKERRAEAVKRWKQKKHRQQHLARKRKVVSSSSLKKNIKNHNIFASDEDTVVKTVNGGTVVPPNINGIGECHQMFNYNQNQVPVNAAATHDLNTNFTQSLPPMASYPYKNQMHSQQPLLSSDSSCWKYGTCAKQLGMDTGAPVSTTAKIVQSDTNIPTAVSARQIATANREREKGKFKRTKTKWIPVTALYGGGI